MPTSHLILSFNLTFDFDFDLTIFSHLMIPAARDKDDFAGLLNDFNLPEILIGGNITFNIKDKIAKLIPDFLLFSGTKKSPLFSSDNIC